MRLCECRIIDFKVELIYVLRYRHMSQVVTVPQGENARSAIPTDCECLLMITATDGPDKKTYGAEAVYELARKRKTDRMVYVGIWASDVLAI